MSPQMSTVAVNMDIHGYIHGFIHVSISYLGCTTDISWIFLSHLNGIVTSLASSAGAESEAGVLLIKQRRRMLPKAMNKLV